MRRRPTRFRPRATGRRRPTVRLLERRAESRGHDLSLEGRRRAAADAGDLGAACDSRCRRQLRRRRAPARRCAAPATPEAVLRRDRAPSCAEPERRRMSAVPPSYPVADAAARLAAALLRALQHEPSIVRVAARAGARLRAARGRRRMLVGRDRSSRHDRRRPARVAGARRRPRRCCRDRGGRATAAPGARCGSGAVLRRRRRAVDRALSRAPMRRCCAAAQRSRARRCRRC